MTISGLVVAAVVDAASVSVKVSTVDTCVTSVTKLVELSVTEILVCVS